MAAIDDEGRLMVDSPRKHRLARRVGVLTVVLATFCAGGLWLWSQGSFAGAPAVSAGPATCPATRNVDWYPAKPVRRGPLLPDGATSALLCVYPFPGAGTVAQLSDTRPAGARASSAVRYLNGLDTDVDGEPMCLSLGRTIYTVVFEYPGGHATVPVGCGVEYAGGSRLGVDLRTLLGFWDVRPE